MTSRVLTSMMEESYSFLRNIVKLAKCNRRSETSATPTKAKRAPRLVNKKVLAPEESRTSDAMSSMSTDTPDTSSNELSDHNSNADTPPGPMRLPPGLFAPPGLETPWYASATQQSRQLSGTCLNTSAPCFVPAAYRTDSCLKASAVPFCPSFGTAGPAGGFTPENPKNSQELRRSIGLLKGALEEWEASLPEPIVAAPVQETNSLMALQQALTKLTPQDSAALRAFLDKKVASSNSNENASLQVSGPGQTSSPNEPRPMVNANPRQPRQTISIAPEEPSFTQFGGKRAAWGERPQAFKAPHKSAPQRTTLPEDDSEESLRTYLRDLAALDSAQVLMLRRVNRLGLDPQLTLTEYFSQFGTVQRVMVAPTRSKAQAGQTKVRMRPAPLGFAVMSKAEEASAVLKLGAEHVVNGECITVQAFESHSI